MFSSDSCAGRVGRLAIYSVRMTPAALARSTDPIIARDSAPSDGVPVEESNKNESRVAFIFSPCGVIGRNAVMTDYYLDAPASVCSQCEKIVYFLLRKHERMRLLAGECHKLF
jgi:hypothetical protein